MFSDAQGAEIELGDIYPRRKDEKRASVAFNFSNPMSGPNHPNTARADSAHLTTTSVSIPNSAYGHPVNVPNPAYGHKPGTKKKMVKLQKKKEEEEEKEKAPVH